LWEGRLAPITHCGTGRQHQSQRSNRPEAGLPQNHATARSGLAWRHRIFYAEALRVLKPGGVLAVWAYGLARITPAIDAVIDDFYQVRVGPFWPPERSWIDDGYHSLPFIPDEFPSPELAMRANWNLDDLLACLATWSAVKRCQAGHGDPLPALREALLPQWGDPQQRLAVEWPLHLRAGPKPGSA
jgi:hypothetical protein